MLRIPRQTASDDTDSSSASATPTSSASSSSTSDSSSSGSSTHSDSSSSSPSSASSKSRTSKPTESPTSALPTSTPNSDPTSSRASKSSSSAIITESPQAPPVQNSQTAVPDNVVNSSPLFITPNSTIVPAANLTTIVTVINGQSTTFTSTLPTNLATGSPSSSSGINRTAVIAGASAAAGVLLICALLLVFLVRKMQLRKAIADALKDSGAKREGRGLLEDEGFDEDNHEHPALGQPAMRSSTAAFATLPQRSGSPAPSHIRSRTSESGSIFREEVWPPPGFVDPISNQSRQVDLSNIVDQVMGPNGGHSRGPTETSMVSAHTSSDAHGSTNAGPTSYRDPFASSGSQDSVYYSVSSRSQMGGTVASTAQLPPGALAPALPGISNSDTTSSTSTNHKLPVVSVARPAAQPKTSSPLARALSRDIRLFSSNRS